jgi:hypothetical protein
MQYILLDLVYFGGNSFLFGEFHSFSEGEKGSDQLRKEDHYLICREKIVKGYSVL